MASIFPDEMLMLLLRDLIPIVVLIIPFGWNSVIGDRWWRLSTMADMLRGWMIPSTVTREAGTDFAQALLAVTRVLVLWPSQLLLLLIIMSSHLGVPCKIILCEGVFNVPP